METRAGLAGERMENVMERTNALKWFWPFMIVAALAAATIVALPQFAGSKEPEPQFRMLVKVTAPRAHVSDAMQVSDATAPTDATSTERYCIQVKAKRPTLIERFADALSHRQPS
jgi:hypothetical protein